jgi:hypothetical protein
MSFLPKLSQWRKNTPRLAIGLVLTVLAILHAIGFMPIKLIQRIDYIFYDARLQWTMPGGIDDRIVIVDVDEKSLITPELGRWPWSRDKMAHIMDTLFEHYQIRLLGFDVIWAEPDNSSGLGTLQKLAKTTLKGDEGFSAAINKIAVKLGTGATRMGIITALVSMSGWIQYLNSTFTRWYYTEIQKLAEPEVMKVMQDLAKAGQAEGSIWAKFGMYAFFIFFTIAVISLVAARMTQKPKNEYVDDKGVEHVAAALPQTEEEPIKDCKTC